MNKRKIIKGLLIVSAIAIVIGGAVAFYMYNMPHRDIQHTATDYSLQASDIVAEYLANNTVANEKYLDAEGESKVLEISGTVAKIEQDFENNKVILLKSESDLAGVSCTFLPDQNSKIDVLNLGQKITIKGVIRSGADFDEDLDMYENVIVDQSTLISVQ
ncbi:MAG: hypothetical protein WAT26_16170 [Saprospiraceae bacterium]